MDSNLYKKKPTIESIRENLIIKGFTNEELKSQILIYSLMHDDENYDLVISKSASILFKLIAN